jgi:hypothetical protein
MKKFKEYIKEGAFSRSIGASSHDMDVVIAFEKFLNTNFDKKNISINTLEDSFIKALKDFKERKDREKKKNEI